MDEHHPSSKELVRRDSTVQVLLWLLIADTRSLVIVSERERTNAFAELLLEAYAPFVKVKRDLVL